MSDFKENQSAVFRENISELRNHKNGFERTRSTRLFNVITRNLFFRFRVFWFSRLVNGFFLVRLCICCRQFIESNSNWGWTDGSNMPLILALITLEEVPCSILAFSITFNTFVFDFYLVCWCLCMNLVWVLIGSRLEYSGLVILTPKCVSQLENV